MNWNKNCRSFKGIQACEISKTEGYYSCEKCEFYEPIKTKILIIKLGAIGDVLRTTPLLEAIKEKYGYESSITWLVKEESKTLLYNNPNIDRILVYNPENILRLQIEKFDVVLSLEIDLPGSAIATLVKAKPKYGFFLNEDGYPTCYNKKAEYYLTRAFSDKINKENKKTYQEMMFDVAELKYNKQDYSFNLTEKDLKYAEDFKKKNEITKPLIGINVGAGGRWQNKEWGQENIINLIEKIPSKYQVILLGGEREEVLKNKILQKVKAIQNESNNSIREFASVINLCDKVITGDTLALHLALALKKKVIGLFLCTPANEVEGYERLEKIESKLIQDNYYSDIYNPELCKSISVEQVLKELK